MISFVLIVVLFEKSLAVNLNTGFTDAISLEEYEDDVELIKIRFDATRPCRFFCKILFWSFSLKKKAFLEILADKRYPKVETGLANCSWYESDACCKRTEVASVFESMFTLHRASTRCRNLINYLMCFFCAPDQYLWYIRR